MVNDETEVLTLAIQVVVPKPVCPVCGYGLRRIPYTRPGQGWWWCDRGMYMRHPIAWHEDDLRQQEADGG